MKRGEIWTVSGGASYTGKPRPAVIVQDDRFDATNSVTVCAFTSQTVEAPLLRPLIRPTVANALTSVSQLMVDKLATVPRSGIGARIGKLDDGDLLSMNRALMVFLGLAG